MKPSTRFRLFAYPITLAATLFFYITAESGGAIIVSPVLPWELGDPNTTYQQYTFSTDSQNPDPEQIINPFGDPSMDIVFVPFIGVGTGWQDPDPDVFSINREDGAWDLGPEGFITVDIPFGLPLPSPAHFYQVEVFIGVVYDDFYGLPALSLSPSASITQTLDSSWELESGFFKWGLITASATIESVFAEHFSISIISTGDFGSLIDTVEIHTRYTLIPEPRVYALLTGLVVLGVVLFSRRRGSCLGSCLGSDAW